VSGRTRAAVVGQSGAVAGHKIVVGPRAAVVADRAKAVVGPRGAVVVGRSKASVGQ